MNPSHCRSATLVVIEFGATWPRWLDPSQTGDMAVVAQHYEGEPSSLITQVAARWTRAESMGWQIHSIVFVSNGHTTRASQATRSVLVRGLMARVEAASGTLTLTVNAPLGSRPYRQLSALAVHLQHELGSDHAATLSVRADSGAAFLSEPPVADTPVAAAS